MNIHLMHDLETLSLKPNTMIVALGAALFDQYGIIATFYQPISLTSQPGRHIDPGTVCWWMGQSDEAREVFSGNKNEGSLEAVLRMYTEWLRDQRFTDGGVWANGSDFDNVVLTDAYQQYNMPMPWKFYQHRCYRTMKSLYAEHRIEREGTHHHAEADAVHQAKHLIHIAKVANIPL